MENNKRSDIIQDIIESGAEITGSVSGALIGVAFAGAPGAIAGGAVGPIITKAFKVMGAEIKNRFLGKREEIRIGAAYKFALDKIKENENNGQTVRDDTFFQSENGQRPSAEEVLEGVILSSQREFEELKIKYLGNLYANICFNQDISREHANQLIKTADGLTYRQFCILQLLRERQSADEQLQFKLRGLDKWEITQLDVVAETRDLHQRGLVYIPTTYDGGNNSNPIQLSKISITLGGQLFCKMLSLHEIEKKELDMLNEQTAIRE